jgi:uncharacterized protein YjbJ (UPF0337 family)
MGERTTCAGSHHMNWDRIEGNWKTYRSDVKQRWERLTDTQLDVVGGHREHLATQIQESYGITKKEAGKQLYDWQKDFHDAAMPKA